MRPSDAKNYSEIGEKGSETWNVAQVYAFTKIMLPLIEIDKLINTARYGTDKIEEFVMTPPEIKTQLRIQALYRYMDELKKIIDNSKFVMSKSVLDEVLTLERNLIFIEKVIGGVSSQKTDSRSGDVVVVINENHFNLCMNKLREIKMPLMDALNKSNLIFPSSDEVDLDKLKNRFVQGG
jgi:hypothetical protein